MHISSWCTCICVFLFEVPLRTGLIAMIGTDHNGKLSIPSYTASKQQIVEDDDDADDERKSDDSIFLCAVTGLVFFAFLFLL
jgi:hypothetical protein